MMVSPSGTGSVPPGQKSFWRSTRIRAVMVKILNDRRSRVSAGMIESKWLAACGFADRKVQLLIREAASGIASESRASEQDHSRHDPDRRASRDVAGREFASRVDAAGRRSDRA